jgi:hypothetical protein
MAILIYSNTAAKNRGGCVVFFYGHRNVKDWFYRRVNRANFVRAEDF